MRMVSQAKLRDRRRPNGQEKFITYCVEMPVSYCIYSKYRKKKLYGQVRADVRDIIKTLCNYKGVEIIEGAVYIDHVHLCVSIPPKMSVSEFMGYLKGKSALMIFDKHPELQNKWNKAFWARGYYVTTIGNVTEETIKKYIQEQYKESKEEDGAAFERQ